MTVSSNKRREFAGLVKRLMPMIFASAGFIVGALACAFSGGLKLLLPSPDMSSAFEGASPLYSVVSCISSELKYAVLIYLLGYCIFGRSACLLVTAYRSALAGLSAVYLLEAGYSLGVYFIHSTASLLTLALLCCMCSLSIQNVQSFLSGKERSDREHILSYTVRCLFFAGLIVVVAVIRQLLLLLV